MGPGVGAPALSLRDVTKTFGGEKALDGAGLDVWPGEIVGLLGANGSGKSTLIKVLAGFHAPDAATGEVAGRPVAFPVDGAQARALGLRFVHQDLGLIPSLTVLENLLIDDLAVDRRLLVPWRRERRRARRLLAGHGIALELDAVVAELAPVEQALLAIVRATKGFLEGAGRGVLVLDEPTVFLAQHERALLFDLVRRIAGQGVAVVFVSHDLEEVRELCHRAVVLRDGRVVGDVALGKIRDDEVVRLIVGGQLRTFLREDRDDAAAVASVEVQGLRGGRVDDASFTAGTGEILGLAGLSGSGFEAVPSLLYGAAQAAAGALVVDGRRLDLASLEPAAAIDAGVVLVPADRASDAVVADLPLADNVGLPVLDRFYVRGRLRSRRVARSVAALLAQFGVEPSDPRATPLQLSGGNQQRAVLAKWLQLSPRLLLLHEPTQGVDVRARQDIFRLLRGAADEGMTVICASSDHEQLGALCDRVLVFRDGRPSTELCGSHVTKEHISEACLAARAMTGSVSGEDAAP